jgi:hypothetical protein
LKNNIANSRKNVNNKKKLAKKIGIKNLKKINVTFNG